MQRRSLQTDQLTDRMVPLLPPFPLPLLPRPPQCHCCSASVAVSFPAVGCLRVSVRLSLPVAHKLFAHPLIIFAHTLTHTHSWCTRAADNVKQQRTHILILASTRICYYSGIYIHAYIWKKKKTKMMMLFQWNMTLRYIRNYLRYSLRWATSSNFRSEQCSQLFHLPPFPCHSLPVGTSVTRKINTKKEKTRSKMKTCIKCKVCANKLLQRATGYPRKPRGRGGLCSRRYSRRWWNYHL